MAPVSALAPFRIRSFRFQWPADLLTSWAFEMEILVLGWYVLVETGSVLFLTVFGALQYGGTLIAPMLGVASDRIGHRNLLSRHAGGLRDHRRHHHDPRLHRRAHPAAGLRPRRR